MSNEQQKFEFKTKESAAAIDKYISNAEDKDLAKDAVEFFKTHAHYCDKSRYQVKLNGTDYLKFLKKNNVSRDTLDKINNINTAFSNVASIAATDVLLNDIRESNAKGEVFDESSSRAVAINTIYGTRISSCFTKRLHPKMEHQPDGKSVYAGQVEVYGVNGVRVDAKVKCKDVAGVLTEMKDAIRKHLGVE